MAIKLAKRNNRAGQKISRGLDISPATYRSRVDMKVTRPVGLGFGRAIFPSSLDLGFAAPECRLVRASNSITVIGAQKCLFYLAWFRCDCARVKRNITLLFGVAQSWLAPVPALLQNVR